MSQTNQQIAEAMDAAHKAGDLDTYFSYYNEDASWTMFSQPAVTGRDNIRKMMEDGMSQSDGIPPVTYTRFISDGDLLACEGHMTMPFKGGPDMAFNFCDVVRFRNGKVQEIRSYMVDTSQKQVPDAQ